MLAAGAGRCGRRPQEHLAAAGGMCYRGSCRCPLQEACAACGCGRYRSTALPPIAGACYRGMRTPVAAGSLACAHTASCSSPLQSSPASQCGLCCSYPRKLLLWMRALPPGARRQGPPEQDCMQRRLRLSWRRKQPERSERRSATSAHCHMHCSNRRLSRDAALLVVTCLRKS